MHLDMDGGGAPRAIVVKLSRMILGAFFLAFDTNRLSPQYDGLLSKIHRYSYRWEHTSRMFWFGNERVRNLVSGLSVRPIEMWCRIDERNGGASVALMYSRVALSNSCHTMAQTSSYGFRFRSWVTCILCLWSHVVAELNQLLMNSRCGGGGIEVEKLPKTLAAEFLGLRSFSKFPSLHNVTFIDHSLFTHVLKIMRSIV